MGCLIGLHPLSLAALCTQVHEGLPGAGSGWLSQGPRSTANEDEEHLLQGCQAATVILHISCNTCSVRARSWRRQGQLAASPAVSPVPARTPVLEFSFECLFKEVC